MGNLNFDATTVQPSSPMEVLPRGKYVVQIDDTEKKETKAQDGAAYLQLTMTVTEGEFKGRKLFDRLNLWNPNTQAVEIAQRTLSALCHSIGIIKPRNHEEFRGKKVTVKVDVRTSQQYGEQNEVKGYEGASSAQESEPKQAVAKSSEATPPWGKK